ncbi:peptidase zinc-dependent [Thermodesulfatator indicus DSM 15286]|uniref:Peptidase zinc-dependent n=1 Tax=Thermodesulfatator indicus (strain DSM 15286 / JCM 11887 / CIR29812) TaxID=667014 RepID=F8AC00_THEID|nr:archaemetzincin [Thermodesulfatator indicus]AEH45698.1 peptidase zinc-dependent [Thermodesulfatator indicus DSM 15286]
MNKPFMLLVPFGKVSGPWLEELIKELAETFHSQVELTRPLSYPPSAFCFKRRRFFAHLLIDFLREKAGPVDFVIGLTDAELYSVNYNSVISESHFQARAAVVSVNKLRDFLFGERPEELFLERVFKEILRSFGHMLGLGPCFNPRCVMYPSLSLVETDLKSSSFCPDCSLKLRLRFGDIPILRKAA